MESLEELRAAVHRDPKGVAGKTIGIVATARKAADQAQLSQALSVLGRARRSLGEIDLAEGDLNEAVAAATAAGDDELRADALIGLAGVLTFSGRSVEAFGHLDEATRIGSDRRRAYAALQRALIEQRLGRLTEALAGYNSALPTLRRIDAHVDIALVLMNRGVVRTQSGDCDGAIADLTESARLFQAERQEFGVAQTRHGLGWAHARRGDIPRAVQHLDAASELFRRLGHDAPEVDVDRIEVLLAAGLFAAAGDLAAETAVRLRTGGNHSQVAEVSLLRCQAALLDGDRTAAAAHAGRARALFADQAAIGWEQAAQLELLRCTGGEAAELVTLAEQLRDSGNARGAATALALASLAASRAGALDQGASLAADCTREAARLGLFEVRMQSVHARAACAAARGDVRKARRQVRSAFDDLARHRTSLAATDARAAVSVHAAELTTLGLRLALATGSAASMLHWIELSRAGRGREVSPRPPTDSDLAGDLTELRSVVGQLRAQDPLHADAAELLTRQRDLERVIQRRTLQAESLPDGARAVLPTIGALRGALHGRLLVELAAVDGRLVAVTVDGRSTRLADLGTAQDLYGVVGTALSALRAAVSAATSGRAHSARALLRRSMATLDTVIRDTVPGVGPVTLVVPPALHVVPWHLLPCMSGRGVTVAPSATWWLRVSTSPAEPAGPAALVAGPRLAEADKEVRLISESYPDARVLTGSAATSEAVLDALAGAGVAHIACHGRVRYDNPLWSALDLYDGPMCVYDLERLRRTPAFVVLSGCETGVGVRAGDQLLGLSATFLEHGTRSLVAAVCPLPDSAATRDTMIGLHQRVSEGAAPAAVLAGLSAQDLDDAPALVAACLSCFGV